jgi:hypothetical protein
MLNEKLQDAYGVHISQMKVIDAFQRSDIAPELAELLKALDKFRKTEPPT